jgi:hypothetical protein
MPYNINLYVTLNNMEINQHIFLSKMPHCLPCVWMCLSDIYIYIYRHNTIHLFIPILITDFMSYEAELKTWLIAFLQCYLLLNNSSNLPKWQDVFPLSCVPPFVIPETVEMLLQWQLLFRGSWCENHHPFHMHFRDRFTCIVKTDKA